MPLISGSSENVISQNIKELIESGYGEKQAAAIAYRKAGKDTVSKRFPDINGWVEIKDNPISKVGIFPYLGSSISDELEPNKVYMIYRPEEELSTPECIESFRLLPWINDHAMLGASEEGLTPPEEKGIEGVIGENVYFEYPYLKANLKVFSENMVSLIDSGKIELSIGYQALYDMTPGIFEGKKYDGIQRHLRGNHIALVEEGRSGKDVSVLDHFKFTIDAKEFDMSTEKTSEMAGDNETEVGLVAKVEALASEFKSFMENMKAFMNMEKKEAEDESEGEEKEKAEDESEESKEEKNEYAKSEDKALRKDFEQYKKEQNKAMDSFMRNYRSEINKVNDLAEQISVHVGTFDHAEMSLNEVAEYGINKLKEKGISIACDKGEELAVIKGFLAASGKNPHQSTSVSDVAIKSRFPNTATYISKITGVH